MHVVLAPDSFKGTMSAREVALALADGLPPSAAVDLCPVADGGEGTLDALVPPDRQIAVRVTDPLGRPVEARYGWVDDTTAVVEMAQASGLPLVAAAERDAEAASTAGTGALLVAAVRAGATTVLVGCGGSATTDGGLGAIEVIREAGGTAGTRVVVLTDVDTPYESAATVFAPQKGADAAAVERLTERLHRIAEQLRRDPRGVPGTGAAGGLAGGLWAECGATIVSGADHVLDVLDFDRRVRSADLVITGEGRIDEQTFAGKLVGAVARRSTVAGARCVAVVGRDDLGESRGRELGLDAIHEAGTPEALRTVAHRLSQEQDVLAP